jgi:hypothetical protein
MKTKTKISKISGTETGANADPVTGAPGSHPVGTGVGAVGGAAAGAAIGALAGPVGAVVGLVTGGLAGGLAGKNVAENLNPTDQDAYWRDNFLTRAYAEKGVSYEVYRPAYRTGFEGYARYPGKKYNEVESDLRRDYEKSMEKTSLSWDKARHATRDAWLRVEITLPSEADGDCCLVNPGRKAAKSLV